MKIKRFVSFILIILFLIEMLSSIVPKDVFAVENADINGNTKATSEEISRNYEIKEEETWDISKNGDGSVIAKWTLSDKTLRISGKGDMKSFYEPAVKDDYFVGYDKIIENVIIEEGITNIGDEAFIGFSRLTNIEIPESVTGIGFYAFSGCKSLTEFNLPENLSMIQLGTFADCSSLKSIEIPKNVVSIGQIAFLRCVSLTRITIPESVWHILPEAFSGCENLQEITIPQNTTSIEEGIFNGCKKLKTVEVAAGNKNFTSENGIFYNKNKTELIKYPSENNTETIYEIPESVTCIAENAFEENKYLENIKIPETVTSIGESAFEG